ncbi:hypothetical protein BDD30_0430 [Photorhabdus asymbiotica]|uniref:Uncharacterized protein n=1 Tax=Photorhabdus asymbiotica TaxID=291112 RepID=A0ABX9SRS2_9GAMM|nr:hypothetical protein BDD30_0430 [Photorhabdus asymbiotica]
MSITRSWSRLKSPHFDLVVESDKYCKFDIEINIKEWPIIYNVENPLEMNHHFPPFAILSLSMNDKHFLLSTNSVEPGLPDDYPEHADKTHPVSYDLFY